MIIKEGTEFLDQLKDKVHEQQREIERLTAESTEWESKYYEEVKKNNNAIEYIENNLLDHNSPLWCDSCEEDNKKLLEILEGEDNE